MWSVNPSINSDKSGYENNFQFNKVLNYNFDLRKLQFERFKIFMSNLYQNIYNNNQNLILQELEQIYARFSRVSLDCNFFSCIMSSLVNYYLLSCSLRSQKYLTITEKENLLNFNMTFRKSLLSKLSNYSKTKQLFCDIPEVILDSTRPKLLELSIDQSAQIYNANNNVAVVGEMEMSVICNLSNDNEFRVFASVLDQDYTKSSKGYSFRKYSKSENTIHDDLNSCDWSLSICCEKTNETSSSCESKQVIDETSFKSLQISSVDIDNKIICAREDSSNSDVFSVSSSDEDSCDYVDSAYNNIISRYFSTLESDCSKFRPYGSDNENSVIFFEDPSSIKAGLSDSDSEYSIIFSEDPSIIKAQLSDSDSEDSIIFSENLSNIKDQFIIFCDEDDSNTFFAFSNKFDSECSTNLDLNDCMSYEDSKQHDLLNSDDEIDEDLNCGLKRCGRSSNICSLSQQRLFTSSLQLNFGFQNPCFEDDTKLDQCGKIKIVNDNWKIMMVDVPEEPRIAKKVSFLPDPELVTVQIFEPDEEDIPSYSSDILDSIRFKNRIKEFEIIMAPFLTVEHRTIILLRNSSLMVYLN